MFRHGVWLGVCLALLAPSVVAADAPVPAHSEKRPFLGGFLKETRIVYPLQLGQWKAQGEHLYEDQRFGVSVRYLDPGEKGSWIDLYFYPAGVLPEEEVGRIAGLERDGIRQAHAKDGQPPDLGDLGRFAFTNASSEGKGEERHGYAFDLTMDDDGRAFSSAMTLLVDRLYFIKGRYSVPADRDSRARTREKLQHFMAQLLPRLEISSSGECWMPLPIEGLEPSQPDPNDAMATMGAPTPVHFVLKDRVVSREPASPEAKVMMFVGMSLHDRLFPGCDGNAPLNPDVPDGMREIRLEYRESGGEGARPGTIRPPKVGAS
jgi:hypothetical protein